MNTKYKYLTLYIESRFLGRSVLLIFNTFVQQAVRIIRNLFPYDVGKFYFLWQLWTYSDFEPCGEDRISRTDVFLFHSLP